MQNLIQDYQRSIRELGPVYQRAVYDTLQTSHRITGIVGPRGIGKTTYMLNYLRNNHRDDPQVLYVSADDLYFSNHSLVGLVEDFVNQYDGKLLCIDEIHKYPNWSQELKNIYDKYRNFRIIFSGSSSIDLIKEKYDLSRRAVLRHLPGLSFREFLEMKINKSYQILSLKQIVKHRVNSFKEIVAIPKLLGLFREYLEVGYYPIFMEHQTTQAVHEALIGVTEKVIYVDIASYYKLKTSSLSAFRKILYFVATSSPSSININRIAQNLGKDHSDVASYLEMMRDTGLLRFLLADKSGHALIRNAEKVYLHNTNLAYALERKIGKSIEKGAMRELFAISSLEHAGKKPFYSAIGNIACDDYIFEIGGKNKDVGQIKNTKNAYLVLDDIMHGDTRTIPLYLFGFLY